MILFPAFYVPQIILSLSSCPFRYISVHHAKEEMFSVLSKLLVAGFVTPDEDMWSVFVPQLCSVSAGGLQFLATYLSLYDLPEKYQPKSVLGRTESGSASPYPLRYQLLDWLLPSLDNDLEDNKVKVRQSDLDWTLLAETVVTLCLRDTRSIQFGTLHGAREDDHIHRPLERLYLQSTFDLALSPIGNDNEKNRGDDIKACSHIQSLEDAALSVLVKNSQQFLDAEPTVSVLVLSNIGNVGIIL